MFCFVPIIAPSNKIKSLRDFPVTFDLFFARLNPCVLYGRLVLYPTWASVRSVQPVESAYLCICFGQLNVQTGQPGPHNIQTKL